MPLKFSHSHLLLLDFTKSALSNIRFSPIHPKKILKKKNQEELTNENLSKGINCHEKQLTSSDASDGELHFTHKKITVCLLIQILMGKDTTRFLIFFSHHRLTQLSSNNDQKLLNRKNIPA